MLPNVFEVDLDAVAHNVRCLRSRVGANVRLFAALKANAYGFGYERIAEAVLAAGAEGVAMVDVQHAIALRQRGIDAPILLYGGILPGSELVHLAEEYRLMLTIVDLESARICGRHAAKWVKVLLKLDVGLERMGLAPEDAPAAGALLAELPQLELSGVYTHLHVPPGDEAESTARYMAWQFGRFTAALAALARQGIDPPIQMAASSAVLMQTDAMSLNAVDPGHLLYGLYPDGVRPTATSAQTGLSAELLAPLDLRPALRALTSRLVQVKTIQRTEFVDQAPFAVRPGMRIGVFPMGIAHGMQQLHCGQVLVSGRRVPVLGVSLEHTRVDLSAVDAQAGDEVVVIGRQGRQEISQEEVLGHLHQHIPAALPLAVDASVARRYVTTSARA